MNLRPSVAGAYVSATMSIIPATLAVLAAFGVHLTKEQLEAITGLAGAVAFAAHAFTGNTTPGD